MTASSLSQTVEIFEPCVRNLDPRKFEIRNIYGTKISQNYGIAQKPSLFARFWL